VANVSPVFKAGEKGSVSNYRPISVLPTTAKVLEIKLVHIQLYAYLQEHNILHRAQSGFKLGHCTQDVVVASGEEAWINYLLSMRSTKTTPTR